MKLFLAFLLSMACALAGAQTSYTAGSPLGYAGQLAVPIPYGRMVRFMSIGDSLTSMNMVDSSSSPQPTAYPLTTAPEWGPNPITLGMAMAKNCYQVISDGISGQNSRQIITRLATPTSPNIAGVGVVNYPALLVFTPGQIPLGNACHNLMGTNDELNSVTINETEANILFAARYEIAHGVQPFFGTLPPRSDYPAGSTLTALRTHITTVNAWMIATLPAMGVPVIDYYSACADVNGSWSGTQSGSVTFTISSASIVNGDTYTDPNGNPYTVTSGTGTLTSVAMTGSAFPDQPATTLTLTRTSGTGAATLTYSATTHINGQSKDGVHWNLPQGMLNGALAAYAVYSRMPWTPIYLAQQDWLLRTSPVEFWATFFEHPLVLNNVNAWSNTVGTGAWATVSETTPGTGIPQSAAAPGFYYGDGPGSGGTSSYGGSAVATNTIEPGLLASGAFSPGNWFKQVITDSVSGANTGWPVGAENARFFDRNFGSSPPHDANGIAVGKSDLMFTSIRISASGNQANNGAYAWYGATANSVSPCYLCGIDTPMDMVPACEWIMSASATSLEFYMVETSYDGKSAWGPISVWGSQPTIVDLTHNGLVPGAGW